MNNLSLEQCMRIAGLVEHYSAFGWDLYGIVDRFEVHFYYQDKGRSRVILDVSAISQIGKNRYASTLLRRIEFDDSTPEPYMKAISKVKRFDEDYIVRNAVERAMAII